MAAPVSRETVPIDPSRPAAATHDASAGPQVVDTLSVVPRRRPTLPTSVLGMKPPAFCAWIFGLIGALPGDSLDDLFPGSGIVGRAWAQYVSPDVARDTSA